MGCTTCGDKPDKKESKDFTKAVIEINNPEQLVLLRKVVIPTSMGSEEDVPAAIGKYRNVLLQYEINGHIYLYSSDGIPTAIESNIPQEVLDRIADLENEDVRLHNDINEVSEDLEDETTARQAADNGLQSQIDAITVSSDVKDVVGTKAALNNYDTSTLGDNDIIKVLQDESEGNATTYYRWNATSQQFVLIGEEGPYYTKSQADTLLNAKQDTLTAGDNITIDNNVISASGGGEIKELTEADFNFPTNNPDGFKLYELEEGLYKVNLTNVQTARLYYGIPGQQSVGIDNGYEFFVIRTPYEVYAYTTPNDFRQFRYIWTTVTGSTGGSVNALNANQVLNRTGASTVWPMTQDATTKLVYPHINGLNDSATIGIGQTYTNANSQATAVGYDTSARGDKATAIGSHTVANAMFASAIGAGAEATTQGQMDISTGSFYPTSGYNNTNYRLLTGLHDPVNAHDAATKGYVDAQAGGGVTVVQTTGTSTTDVMSQNATTSMVYADPATQNKIRIGSGASSNEGTNAIEIGASSASEGNYSVAIGNGSRALTWGSLALGYSSNALSGFSCVAIGNGATAIAEKAVALGSGARAALRGEFNIGAGNNNEGYNNTNYRLISGVYDGQGLHDAATVAQGNTLSTSAPTTTTAGVLGQLYSDTTNGVLYQCTAIDNTDPQNPVYTWSSVGGGGGGGSTITMTNTDPGEGSPLAADNYIAVYGGDPIIMDYSTNEVNTGTKWVDGSIIYRKTINFGALPNATSKTVAHNISNLNRIIKITGYAYSTVNQTTYPIPFVSKDNVLSNIGTTANATAVEVGTGTDRTNLTECYITLYYTKSA